MRPAPGKADWLTFVLHFLFGLIVGCVIGLCFIARRRHGIWLDEELILPYLCGTSLIGAGLGAKLGDRLWIGDNYRIIPPDAPSHSKLSRFLFLLSIVSGTALTTSSLWRHFF